MHDRCSAVPRVRRIKPQMKREQTYCFDALMKDRFMDEVEFAKFPDEFNVAKHLDLGDGTLLLLLRCERVVMFVVHWGERRGR